MKEMTWLRLIHCESMLAWCKWMKTEEKGFDAVLIVCALALSSSVFSHRHPHFYGSCWTLQARWYGHNFLPCLDKLSQAWTSWEKLGQAETMAWMTMMSKEISWEMIERGKYRNKGNTGLSRLSGTKPEPEIKDNQQNIFFLPRKTNNIRVWISFTLYAFLWHKVNNCLIFSFTDSPCHKCY